MRVVPPQHFLGSIINVGCTRASRPVYPNIYYRTKILCYTNGEVNIQKQILGLVNGKIYKREVFDNLRFPSGYWFEDTIVEQIIWPLASSIYTVSEYVYEYRTNPHGITRTSMIKHTAIDSLYITETLLNDFEKFGLELDERSFCFFLRMVVLTESRTVVCNGKIAKCIFCVQCCLYERFAGVSTSEYSDIQEALRGMDFKKYIEAIISRKKETLIL